MGRYSVLYRLASILVTISLLASVFLFSFTYVRADEEVARISVGPSLTAVLDTHGVLTLEGAGRSDPFTVENAPLTPYADQIRQVVIPEGVTALGDRLFYGCYGLTGTLELPSTLVELGDQVFSGPDRDRAPRFTWIFNDFTSCEEVVTAQDVETVRPPVDQEPLQSETPVEEDLAGAEYLVAEDAGLAGYTLEGGAAPGEYAVETLYAQRVGEEVFYPAQGEMVGLALYTMENLSFLNAAMEGGYSLADGEVRVTLLPGDGEGERVTLRGLTAGGTVTAPPCPEDFAPSMGGGGFLGWMGEDGETLYASGDAVPVPEGTEELALCAFWGGAELQTNGLAVTFDPGVGGGTAVSRPCENGIQTYARWPEDLGFTAPTALEGEPTGLGGNYRAAIVFGGWQGSDGNLYDPGDLVKPDVILTARWVWAVVGKISDIGRENSWGSCHLSTAMNNLSGQSQDTEDKYRNILVVDRDAALRANYSGDDQMPSLACTVTGLDPIDKTQHANRVSMDSYNLSIGYIFTRLTRPMVFHHVSLTAGHKDAAQYNRLLGRWYFDGFYANCNKLVMGYGVNVTGTLNIFGGAGGGMEATSVEGAAHMNIFSGVYQRLYGGSFLVAMTGGNRILNFLGGEVNYLFGGGYQKGNSTSKNSIVYMAGGTVRNDITASSDQGKVIKDGSNDVYSSITMVGGKVLGNVYGGVYGGEDSSESSMEGNTFLAVFGNDTVVEGDVFGGGNSSPLTGSTSVTIQGGTVRGNVYGGGNQATVTGDPTVVVTGTGQVKGSVYGGGFSSTAVVTGSTSVSVEGGSVAKNVYGGGQQAVVQNSGDTGGEAAVSIKGGTVSGNVFGGGEGLNGNGGIAAVCRSVQVSISGGEVQGSVYGGGSQSDVGLAAGGEASATVTITGGVVDQCVFGGGHEGKVGLGTVDDATATATVDVPGATTITISGGMVGEDVFGGGSGTESNMAGAAGLGAVFGHSRVLISGGYVGKRVFGGSNMARVTGNTSVDITSDRGRVEIAQTVYGGGNGQGIYFDENTFLVLGASRVNVEKTAHDLTIGGSLFGSGNLTRVKGGTDGEGRRLSIKGLTGELDSLQRADHVTIVDSNLTLTGATDKVDGTTLNFSIAQVAGEVRLINSSLHVRTEINEVKAFGSYMDDGGTVEDSSGRNVLTILAGRLLAFGMTDPASKVFTYGHVSGVTTLRWEEDRTLPEPDQQGVFVHGDLASNIGDKEADPSDTGAFIADPDQPGGHSLRSGQTAEYSSWHLGGDSVTIRQVLKLTGENADENGKFWDSVVFRLPTLVLKDTEFSCDAPDLSNFSAPLTQNGDQVLTLDVEGHAMWGTKEYSIYIVDGVDGRGEIIHREGGRPVTLDQGRPAFIAKLSYKDPKTVPTGVVRVQLRAYEKGKPELSRGNVTLDLTIEGSGKGTAVGRAVAGRRYEPFKTYGTPIIAANGEVTCQVVLNYTPIGTETDSRGEIPVLKLIDKSTGDVMDVSPHVLMADFFTPDSPRWYFGTLEDKEKGTKGSILLDQLQNVRGLADWQAPDAGITVADKSMLFILDFRDTPLPEGNYYLSLEFPGRGSCVSSGAPFQVEAHSLRGTLTWRGTTLAVTSPARDVDYADGALVRLTGLSGEAARNVTAIWDGEVAELLAGDRAVFLRLPGLGRGLSAQVSWTFPQMDRDTVVTAELFPLPTFQTHGLGSGGPSATAKTTLSGSGEGMAADWQLLVDLQREKDRLVEGGKETVLTFRAAVDGGLGAGETVAVTRVARKIGDDPADDSYREDASGWSYAASPDDPLAGALTLPGDLAEGTYRIFFQLTAQDGAPLARCSYNIIVYTP